MSLSRANMKYTLKCIFFCFVKYIFLTQGRFIAGLLLENSHCQSQGIIIYNLKLLLMEFTRSKLYDLTVSNFLYFHRISVPYRRDTFLYYG